MPRDQNSSVFEDGSGLVFIHSSAHSFYLYISHPLLQPALLTNHYRSFLLGRSSQLETLEHYQTSDNTLCISSMRLNLPFLSLDPVK